MSIDINLDNVEEVDITKKKKEERKIFKTDILDEDEKEKGTPGPKKRRKDTQIKTYNLDIEVIKKIEEYCDEHEISASIFVNRVLKKEFEL
ncbi:MULTISPECIES: hypothetical protein [unclassified Bacillus cereus group]|uniref:hypothetical protein n=1 Tax=unclassified Bacillus cereus group TaxID=2750818 RepID=UPI0029C5CB3A|nr:MULTISPECIES: hypothetical protein [unclassified Bacillus cereus group]MDX5880827.1 hypothetical protein [Bacillus cereus group sp. BfR-BA-01042]MDX5906679.1 hypothetical protein [Bacillus cereus group sp. BfR-BA-01048]